VLVELTVPLETMENQEKLENLELLD